MGKFLEIVLKKSLPDHSPQNFLASTACLTGYPSFRLCACKNLNTIKNKRNCDTHGGSWTEHFQNIYWDTMNHSTMAYTRHYRSHTTITTTTKKNKIKMATKWPLRIINSRNALNNTDIHNQLEVTITMNNQNNYHYMITEHSSSTNNNNCIGLYQSILTCCVYYTVNQKVCRFLKMAATETFLR